MKKKSCLGRGLMEKSWMEGSRKESERWKRRKTAGDKKRGGVITEGGTG